MKPVIAILILAASLATPVMAAGNDRQTEARVDTYLAPYLDTGNFSGTVLIARKGRILLSKGYGWASLEHQAANTPDTVFHLASVSRVFTPAAILLLEQQGRLHTGDKLSRYLPDWPNAERISIHHLLTLSAGFPNMNSLPDYPLWQQFPQTPASLVEKFRDLPLEFEPGTRSVHSNSNYNLLALLIEQISGQSFGEFLQQQIFAPLGMSQSGHHGDASQVIRRSATGYQPDGLAALVRAPVIDWSVKAGNGSLYSTTEDLYRMDRALVNAGLLNAASVSKLFSEHFPSNGYGWFVGQRFGSAEVHINGRSPGFGTYWGRSVNEDVTVIVLGNIYNSVTTTIGRDLIAMALGEDYQPPQFNTQPLAPELLAELTGNYQFGPDFYAPNALIGVQARDGHLFSAGDWLMPVKGLDFMHRLYWSDMTFLRDGQGRINALEFGGFVGHKTD